MTESKEAWKAWIETAKDSTSYTAYRQGWEDSRKISCRTCKKWKLDKTVGYLPEDEMGECSGLYGCDEIEYYLTTGWDGGYISEVETKANFFCALWVARESVVAHRDKEVK